MAQVRAHVLISGIVQGVGFRWAACRQADALGVTGWVRNRWNSDVEAVFEGEESDVRAMVEWCRRGPISAVIKDVDVEWQPPTGEFDGFGIAW